MAVLDTLDIKISANAMNAAKALDALANSMKRVRAALLNTKDGVAVGDQLARSIHELNNAMTRINADGIKKLNQLSDALQRFAATARSIKGISIGKSVANSIQNTQDALSAQAGTATSPGGSAYLDTTADKVKNVGDEVERAGRKAKRSAGFFDTLWGSIKRIALYRAIRSAMKAISEAFSEGLKNAYQYSKQSSTFTRLAETLDHLKSVTSQMTNQLGAFWGEFRQFIQPAITWLIEKVRQLSEWLTELFAALNGEKTYLQAQFVAQEWDDATDAVKKYKHQLLGLDELNNLTSQNKSGKEETDYSKLYKEVPVSQSMLAIGAQWGSLKKQIVEALTEIELELGMFMVGVGAALLFSGADISLGLGLIIAGGFMSYKAVKEQWSLVNGNLSEQLVLIEELLGGSMAALGAVLLFSGAAPQWGLGLIIAGIGLFSAAKKRKTNWDKMDKKMQGTLAAINLTLGGFLGVIGAFLLFSGTNIPLGLGCLIAGIATISSSAKEAKNINWLAASDLICDALVNFFGPAGLLAFGAAELAIGALLAFSGTHIALGIALMAAGVGSIGLAAANIDWMKTSDAICDALMNTFGPGGLMAFGYGLLAIGVLLAFTGVSIPIGVAMIAAGVPLLGFGAANLDWKGLASEVYDRIVGFFGPGGLLALGTGLIAIGALLAFTGVALPVGIALMALGAGSLGLGISSINWDAVLDNLKEAWEKIKQWWRDTVVASINNAIDWVKGKLDFDINFGGNKNGGGGGRGFATGGIPDRGSMFIAGEAGPEFVGSIGGSSAVANTEQMTDAIYKAAYMGMSQALRENGGGMSGFVPATTDDLFIAMRKKASNYNKRTGSSAFA